MILKYTVFILALINIALSYKQYKYHELCPGSKFKAYFDKITNNKPEVKLNEGHESAALIQYRSNAINNKKVGSCEFDVKVYGSSGDGIFASIKNLKLRERSYSSYGEDQSCEDFIRFTYKNGTSTRPICGNIATTVHNNLIRNFFDETSGEMRVEIYIDSSHSSSSSDEIVVDLVFTAYTRCPWNPASNQVRCSNEKCISDIFQNDQILNCPPPGCSDESECVNYEKPQITYVSPGSGSGSRSGSAHIIIPIVVVLVAILLGVVCFCKKRKPATNSQRSNEDHVEELRPTARSDLDSYLQFQDVRRVPLVPTQEHYTPMPLVPPVQRPQMPMPLVPPQQQHEMPMPSAPPGGFKDDPPPYDALFSAPNQRTNV